MDFHFFDDAELRILGEAIASVSLVGAEMRGRLLCDIQHDLSASLPVFQDPRHQIASDLEELNRVGRLSDKSVPMRQYLENARVLASPHPSAALFDLYAGRLREDAPRGLSPRLRDSEPTEFWRVLANLYPDQV